MSRVCEICNKGVMSGVSYSHSHRQNKRKWAPNLLKLKIVQNDTPQTVSVCARCLRTINNESKKHQYNFETYSAWKARKASEKTAE